MFWNTGTSLEEFIKLESIDSFYKSLNDEEAMCLYLNGIETTLFYSSQEERDRHFNELKELLVPKTLDLAALQNNFGMQTGLTNPYEFHK